MRAVNVVLVEDDRRLAGLLVERLRNEGYDAETAATGTAGLELALSGRFDVAVVDVMLPGLDGLELARTVRRHHVGLPILMLTARDAIEDRVAGLRAGADDYLVKPFAFAELLARIEALTRRLGSERVLAHDGVAVDPAARRVTVRGEPVELTAKEFDLLECLMRNAGRVLTRSELKELVWDFSFDARTKVVDLYVHYLRRKLARAGAPDVIETVRGVGYVVGR
jgi:DNA-binding response OmpR family regulator